VEIRCYEGISNTGSSQLSRVMVGGGEITDNPKAWLKQKQLKHGTKWI
jgi:hypothetical protein